MPLNSTYKRTLSETISYYKKNKNFRDLYVEGSVDKNILTNVLDHLGCKNIVVKNIDIINITDTDLVKYKFSSGNKNRLLTLALELELSIISYSGSLYCLADSDYSFIIDDKINSPYLIYTDFTDIEMYFYEEYIIDKIKIGIQNLNVDAGQLLDNFTEILKSIFYCKLANIDLGWNMESQDHLPCCAVSRGTDFITFNDKDFIDRYLQKNNRFEALDIFMHKINELTSVIFKSRKCVIRGHDYLKLLGWYLNKTARTSGHHYLDNKVMETIVFSAVDLNLLIQYKLFKNLIKLYKC